MSTALQRDLCGNMPHKCCLPVSNLFRCNNVNLNVWSWLELLLSPPTTPPQSFSPSLPAILDPFLCLI